MRQELVSLAALAAEQEEQSAPSSAPGRRRRRTALIALAGVAVAAIVLAATVWLVRGPSDADPSGAPSSQPDAESSQATPSTTAASRQRCWDGRVAEQGAELPRRRRGCRDCSGCIPASSRTVPTADGSRGRCRRARCSPTSVLSTPTTRTRASGTASGSRPQQPARSSPVTSPPGPSGRRAGGLHLVGLDPGEQ